MNLITSKKDCLKIGVIGCGWITEYIKPITKNLENIKIVAAVDPILEKANRVASKDHSYTNTEKMYKNENIDAVYIATPNYLHKPMIKHALEEGKHIFCEKPVSTSIEDAREIFKLDKSLVESSSTLTDQKSTRPKSKESISSKRKKRS